MPRSTPAISLRRPVVGLPSADDFLLGEAPLPEPTEGQALLAVEYLSIDPYLRPLLAGRHLEAAPAIGAVIPGLGLGRVLQSRAAALRPGDRVVAETGWRRYAVVDAARARRIEPDGLPPSCHLGVLGLPGLTAWAGIRTIARPAPGETVLVSAAAGAVGSLAGQLARLDGARVVAINGSAAKNALCRNEYGFHAAVDYRAPDFRAALRAACPEGIDVYFDNVGGAVLEAALGLMRRRARVVLCGLIDQYNADQRPPGPNLGPVIAARATLTGLVVYDHLERFPEFQAEVAPRVANGAIRYREDIAVGLAQAPQQFIKLLTGGNVGKTLVRLSPEEAG